MNFSAAILALVSIVTSAPGGIGLDGNAALDRPPGGAGGKGLRRQEDSRYNDPPPSLNTCASNNFGEVVFVWGVNGPDWSDTNDEVLFYFYAGDKLLIKITACGLFLWSKYDRSGFHWRWYDVSTGWLKVEASLGTPTHADMFIMGDDASLVDQACM